MQELVLEGIDGNTPIGFLSAVGVLVVLDNKWPGQIKLGWVKRRNYHPILNYLNISKEDLRKKCTDQTLLSEISTTIATVLSVPFSEVQETESKAVEQSFKGHSDVRKKYESSQKQLKKTIKNLNEEGKRLGLTSEELRKMVDEKSKAIKELVNKNYEEVLSSRKKWLDKLRLIVPSPELRLGKTISVTPEEYHAAALDTINSCSDRANCRVADLLAAFASESVVDDRGYVKTTPFCFITGSGHQYFLETVRKLMEKVDANRIEKCLFHQWDYNDECFSLRWAHVEDRRYALMPGDPGGQKAKTVWAANLLAYNGLRLMPVSDVGGRLGTTAFSTIGRKEFFSWPIWTGFLNRDCLLSLLSLNTIIQSKPDRTQLDQMGIVEIFRSERIQIGTPPLVKINFSMPFPAGMGYEVD